MSDFLASAYNRIKGNEILIKIHDKLKTFINLIRIPSVMSFFILKNGTINPTLQQSLNEATPASENWDRLGMETKTSFGLPRWLLFAFVVFVVAVRYWSEILTNIIQTFSQTLLASNSFPAGAALPFKYSMDGLQYLVNFCAQFGALLPLAAIGYFIVKSIRGK